MKKILIILFFAVIAPLTAYGLYFDFGVNEIPMLLLGTDQHDQAYYSFMNIANLDLGLNISDNSSLKFQLKDFYSYLSNANYLYVSRLSYNLSSDSFGILAGRDMFVENNGMLVGNLADGLKIKTSLLSFKQRFYGYYSGLLIPDALNQFTNKYASDTAPSRLNFGGAFEFLGLLGKSVSLNALYSMDMSTNQSFFPFYIGANGNGSIVSGLTYDINAAYELGTLTNQTSISAYAGDINLIYLIDSPKIGFTAKAALASGDNKDTTNVTEGFYSFGKYGTTDVLSLDFSNMFMFDFGMIFKFLDDNFKIQANYRYIMRLSTNDTVFGLYTGTGASAGSEIAGSLNYDFDPNFSVFVKGGYFIRGDAFTSTTNAFNVICGTSIKL